jgi:hypothetical protein
MLRVLWDLTHKGGVSLRFPPKTPPERTCVDTNGARGERLAEGRVKGVRRS